MTTSPRGAVSPAPDLPGRLGVGSISFMVLAGAAPLTAVTAIVPFVLVLSQNSAGAVYFVVSAAVLALFAVGYMLMTKHVTEPGAMYSYITAGLGRVAGTGAATLAVAAYFANLIAVYAYGGVLTAQTVVDFTGWTSPWWLWSAVMFALVAILGYRNIDVSAKVLGVVLVAETVIVLVVDVGIILSGGAEGLNAEPLNPIAALSGAPGLGIMFAFIAFVGFEATAVFRSEAKDPDRTVPRATYLAVIGIGVFYAFSSWAFTLGFGNDEAVAAATKDPTMFIFSLADRYASPIVSDVMQVLLLTSIFACLLTLHNVIARYQMSMSLRGILPAFLGRIHERHLAPSNSSGILSAATAVALTVVLVTGMDPITEAYGTLAGAIGYGIIVLMAATSLAVIVYFRRRGGPRFGWRSTVAPAFAFVALVAIGVVSFANIDILTGDPTKSIIVIGYLAAAVLVGIVLAVVRRPAAAEPPVDVAHKAEQTVI